MTIISTPTQIVAPTAADISSIYGIKPRSGFKIIPVLGTSDPAIYQAATGGVYYWS